MIEGYWGPGPAPVGEHEGAKPSFALARSGPVLRQETEGPVPSKVTQLTWWTWESRFRPLPQCKGTDPSWDCQPCLGIGMVVAG